MPLATPPARARLGHEDVVITRSAHAANVERGTDFNEM
jgi:hypothetical protein